MPKETRPKIESRKKRRRPITSASGIRRKASMMPRRTLPVNLPRSPSARPKSSARYFSTLPSSELK